MVLSIFILFSGVALSQYEDSVRVAQVSLGGNEITWIVSQSTLGTSFENSMDDGGMTTDVNIHIVLDSVTGVNDYYLTMAYLRNDSVITYTLGFFVDTTSEGVDLWLTEFVESGACYITDIVCHSCFAINNSPGPGMHCSCMERYIGPLPEGGLAATCVATSGGGWWYRIFHTFLDYLWNKRQSSANRTPAIFSLQQNYPNPFKVITAVRYSLPEDGVVKLIVTDVIGRELATLVDQYQGGGTHTVTFFAPDLPSGHYFASITVRGLSGSLYSRSTEMVLNK